MNYIIWCFTYYYFIITWQLCVNAPAELSFGCLLLSIGHSLNVDEANPHLKPATGQDCPAAQITMVTRLGFTLTTLMERKCGSGWWNGNLSLAGCIRLSQNHGFQGYRYGANLSHFDGTELSLTLARHGHLSLDFPLACLTENPPAIMAAADIKHKHEEVRAKSGIRLFRNLN